MSAKAYIEQLQDVQTPCYFYDMNLLRETLTAATTEASRYGYRIHYALKANFDERILSSVIEAGMGVDCVSGNEVRTAIESGCPASEVVFAGVGKTDEEIRYALEQGIFSFNVESLHELQVINTLSEQVGKVAQIALRINPDVDPQTHKYIATGQADSKFGIAYTEVNEAIAQLHRLQNIRIVGLHFHVGSQIRKMEVFEALAERVNTIAQWFEQQHIELKHLNLGGGLGINYTDPDSEPITTFAHYFTTIHKTLNVKEGQTVHFELGRALVAQCGELLTRVLYEKKTASGASILVVDAGMNDLIRPALYQAHHRIENLTSTEPTAYYSVVGPVCESSDVFDRNIELPASKRGDLLTLRSAGAYGASMASRYNLRDLPLAIYSDQF